MNKPWLLIIGDDYYPARGTGDWVSRFETEKDAAVYAENLKDEYYPFERILGEGSLKWCEIVNLETWGLKNTKIKL